MGSLLRDLSLSAATAGFVAVLVGDFGMAEATGAFIACAALITLFGVTGWFEKLLGRIPMRSPARCSPAC